MKRIVGGLLLLFGSMILTAHADTNYQVEIIVFTRDSGDGEDSLRSSAALHYPVKTVMLTAGDNSAAPFQLLAPDKLLLNREAGAIEQRKSMHMLLHQAWIWPGEDSAHASAVIIGAGRQFGNHRELEGYIALSAEHFLKIDTQLWLSRFVADNGALPADILSLPTAPGASSDAMAPANEHRAANTDGYFVSQLFLLREQRRMRSGELHYFDHARLGLLVQVTPLATTP